MPSQQDGDKTPRADRYVWDSPIHGLGAMENPHIGPSVESSGSPRERTPNSDIPSIELGPALIQKASGNRGGNRR